MAHRDRRTAKDPDVEASQVELAAIAAEKETKQGEVLAIAQNKKELEQAFEESKVKLDAELTAKRESSAIEIAALDKIIAAKKVEAEVLEKENVNMRSFNGALKTEGESLRSYLARKREELSTITTAIDTHTQTGKKILTDIKTCKDELEALVKNKEAAELGCKNIEQKLKELHLSHSAKSDELSSATTEFKQLLEHKAIASAGLRDIELKISDKKDVLSVLNQEEISIQKKISEQKEFIAKQDADSTLRMGNAARLEQHVDKKLSDLKAVEAHFTTEHLARIGYKKTD